MVRKIIESKNHLNFHLFPFQFDKAINYIAYLLITGKSVNTFVNIESLLPLSLVWTSVKVILDQE